MAFSNCSEKHVILSALARALDLPVDEIDTSKSFTELGGHSLSALEVYNECKNAVRQPPSVLSLLVSPSLHDLLPTGTAPEVDHATAAVDTPATSDSGFIEPRPFEETSEPRIAPAGPTNDSSLRGTDEQPIISLLSPGATSLPDSSSSGLLQVPVTEMQRAFIHGGQSTITWSETWPLEDIVVLKHAWKTVVSMEPIFRTSFEEDGSGSYVMRLQDAAIIPWEEVVTFDHKSYYAETTKRESLLQPSFRFKTVIYKSSGRDRSEGTIILAVHHALLDGWSMALLTKKVRRMAVGETGIFAGKSFLSAADELCQITKKSEHLVAEFWRDKTDRFATAANGLNLPKPRKRGADGGANEVNNGFSELADRLRHTSKRHGVTVATIFYSAWALTHALYADTDAVVVGAILNGRNLPLEEIDTVVGPMLNSFPLYVSLNQEESTGDLVRRVFRSLAELSCYQWSTAEQGFSRSFEAALSVTRGLEASDDPIRPLRASHYDFESGIPLSLAIDEAAMTVRLVYHPDCYTRECAEDLVSSFRNALEGLTRSTNVRECLQSLLTVRMQGRLRALSNCSSGLTVRSSHPEDLVSLIQSTMRSHPQLTALEAGDQSITYSELDRRASSVSKALSNLNVSGQVVCLHADGSLNWVVGLVGALKAGATICSLDATLPPDLRYSMFNVARCSVFLVGSAAQTSFKPRDCPHCLVVDEISSDSIVLTQKPPARTPNPAAPAYLCFTSGSTGKPKGVLCTHQGLVAFQKDREVRLNAAPGVRIAQFMSPAFDGSIHEIFSALCYGATLVLRSSANPFDVLHSVDSTIMTPSVARTLEPKEFPNLKTVYLVGEQVPPSVVEQWASGRKLYNMYGPTEGTCGATITQLIPGRPVTIGRPNPTSRVYILGRNGSLMPPGAIGEIHIAGVQVSLGYLDLPQETEERFLQDTVCPQLGEMMYKTGDRGYWDENGEIVCLGRNDRQVKLRGFRLDLDDLEVRIAKAYPGVKAVALTRPDGRDTLVAMVQPANLDAGALRKVIRAHLPRQAVPSAIACVDSFPMTRAGKVDLKTIAEELTCRR